MWGTWVHLPFAVDIITIAAAATATPFTAIKPAGKGTF